MEYFVGSFDAERASGTTWTADEFNEHAAIHAAASWRAKPRLLTGEDLARVRARRDELFLEWFALPAGETLDLGYEFAQC